jgi:fatty-acyl-CoA synthase
LVSEEPRELETASILGSTSSRSTLSLAPTSNALSVWEHWRGHAEKTPEREAIVHWQAGADPVRWRWGELMGAVHPVAQRLKESGVRRHDVCAIIIRHDPRFYPIYLAISSIGALPAVLAYPNKRLHPDKFREGLEGMARVSGLNWVLSEKDLEPVLAPLIQGEGSTIRDILFPLEWDPAKAQATPTLPHPSIALGDPCLLQHSSGTTGLQKAVVLSQRAVIEHVRRYGAAIELTATDRVASWLPLYHDMGLIAAFYLPLISGVPIIQLDPFEWVSAPIVLLEAISRERATLCWLPNFAYNLMADRIREEDMAGIRLDSVRMLINCSEPVRAESHDRFKRRFSAYGIRAEALAASYAMAETTFAVTQTTPGRPARILTVLRDQIVAGKAEPAEPGANGRACVSSGLPIPGCEVRILDEAGEVLPERKIGEIAVRSVSLFDGYRNLPAKTAEVMRDGWYLTGDYGFLDNGECFVVGRKKDLIVVAGKNLYPEDIEDAVGGVVDVVPGRVVAFSIEDDRTGTEHVCVVAETACLGEAERRGIRRAVIEAAMAVDVTVARVYLARPRWLVKSSAGKLSRHANRDRAIAELDFEKKRAQ